MTSVQPFLGRVAIVDDDSSIQVLLAASLGKAGFEVETCSTIAELRGLLKGKFFDAVLLDFFLEEENALGILPHLVANFPYTKVFIMSGRSSIELAVSAMEMGASTFISKSQNHLEIVNELKTRLKPVPREINSNNPVDFKLNHGIIGNSERLNHVLRRIEMVRDVDSTVLITGESGTGKELVARAIHDSSRRANKRFEALNCGAIPVNLLESELFGHKRGAYTDAKVDRKGIFELCDGGSLFLDEIGEMPIELQVKLLRVLQDGEFSPLGSSVKIKVDTRVITATNRNLEEEIGKKNFREDLYFRLAVLTIELPSLRDRREDIPELLRHFTNKICEKFSKTMAPMPKSLEDRLVAYDWPGNIRELQNAVERGIVLSPDGNFNLEDMLPHSRPQHNEASHTSGGTLITDSAMGKTLSEAKLDFEGEYLRQLLKITNGNISEIARIAGRYRADVYRLLAKHDVDVHDFRAVAE